jgi:hypothetical protein
MTVDDVKPSAEIPQADRAPAASASELPTFAPSEWRLNRNARSDPEFIKIAILSVLHRTGSTLLQRICNSRKGTLIWGEHAGVLEHFADIFASMAVFSKLTSYEREEYFQKAEDPNCWIANMSPDLEFVQQATVESARAYLNALYSQYSETHDLIGFKEVRYTRPECELIRACYPQAEILFLVRNPIKMWNSTPREWYPVFDEWAAKWTQESLFALDYSLRDPHCHLFRYEDIVRQEKTTMSIISDVAKVTQEQMAEVIAHKIGSFHNRNSNHYGVTDAERARIMQVCREPMSMLGYC